MVTFSFSGIPKEQQQFDSMLKEVKHLEELGDDTAIDIEAFCKAMGHNF